MSTSKKTFVELISEYDINIPLIQRDYAQGRKSEKDKAIRFLSAIKAGLESGLNLDFIYGKRDNDKKIFTPLDGQQRLTTLFLLYWYLSLETQYNKELTKFSYEVRSSSKDFLDELTKEDNWKKLKKAGIEDQIKNMSWFFLSWMKDPTVVSVLSMLTLIEEKFKKVDVEKLNNITFDILYLDKFELTDELYVKMNARGKSLTRFENFKAEFEAYIEEAGCDRVVITQIKVNLDNKWLDLFWNLAKKEISISEAPKLVDEMFYNFFYNMAFNLLLENQDKSIKLDGKEYSIINKFIEENDIFSFYREAYNEDNIKNIVKLLDNVKVDDNFNSFVQSTEISQWERARFYALHLGYINDLSDDEFTNWRRVAFNLINNQLIQSPEDLIKTIQSLKELIKKSENNIYEFIEAKPNNIKYFTKEQREEESLKAKLILSKDNLGWKKEIEEAEDNWYLDGQIGFLLEFAENNFDKFVSYRDKFIKLWNFAKVNEEKQIKIYQALLTKGDYLPKIASNYSFCSFAPALRTKIDNWRDVFNSKERGGFFKTLLDDIDTDADVENSLNKIINESELDDWREFFIRNDENIKYLSGDKLIRFDSEEEIYLLQKSQMNGRHAELRSWDFFTREFGLKESDKIFRPFSSTFYWESTSSELPCIVLGDYESLELWISYENEKYCITLFDDNSLSDTDRKVLIKQCKFVSEEKQNQLFVCGLERENVIGSIEKICEELEALSI